MTNIVERVCYRHMEMLTAPIIVHDYCYYCWWCTLTVLYQNLLGSWRTTESLLVTALTLLIIVSQSLVATLHR